MKTVNEAMIKLKEANELDFFKTTGLDIAKRICEQNGNTNTNCHEVANTVVTMANKLKINCKVVSPFVIHYNKNQNGHSAILYDNTIIDYCIKQFDGDNRTVDFYQLAETNIKGLYAIDSKSMRTQKLNLQLESNELKDIFTLLNNEEFKDFIFEIV